MAYTPRELDRVNSILITDDVLTQRISHALVAYTGIDGEATGADRSHPPARPWE